MLLQCQGYELSYSSMGMDMVTSLGVVGDCDVRGRGKDEVSDGVTGRREIVRLILALLSKAGIR